jgi:hypothetical protein
MVLLNAHVISLSFLVAFERLSTSADEHAKTLSENQIRAMLVFASAGLDSMVKHLIEDALPVIIKEDALARERLRDFVEDRIKKDEQPDYRILARVFVADNPLDEMIALLVSHLTDNSLQSVDQLLRVASFFAIEASAIISNPKSLRQVFQIRNEIIHEMDIDSSILLEVRPDFSLDLKPRDRDDMVAATNQLLAAAGAFLVAVEAKLTAD